MNGFTVESDELHDAAGSLDKHISELRAAQPLKWWLSGRELGHDELGRALELFQGSSQRVVEVLSGDTRETADRLRRTAEIYLSLDEEIATRLSVVRPTDW